MQHDAACVLRKFNIFISSKDIKRIDAFYLKFLRRLVNIKASYYSRISNHVVWKTAGYPIKPSYFLLNSQYKILSEVFHTDSSMPLHHVVFNSACRDRIIVKGRRRGWKKPSAASSSSSSSSSSSGSGSGSGGSSSSTTTTTTTTNSDNHQKQRQPQQ